MTVHVTRQFAVESFCLQEVNPAAVDQAFTETTNLLAFFRRQKPAEEEEDVRVSEGGVV